LSRESTVTTFYRARFTAELVDDDLIVVVDLDLPNTKSVTNDAERVVATIADYVTIGKRQIVYRDSSGRWDGIAVRREREFGGFVGIGAETREAAIEAARRLRSSSWRKL
jgi:hypothetical protein